jgi:glycosyltransferase involved in cell wall biosynthesis
VLVLFGGDRMFGSEIGNLEVFRQMAKLGLKARFITRGSCGHLEIQPALDRLGFEWTTAPFGFHWGRYLFGRRFYYLVLNIYGLIATNWRLWREVRNWKPTHLYCMNWTFFTYAMPAILWLRLPLIYRAGDDVPTHTPFHRWVSSKLSRRVNRTVCISTFIHQCMVRAGFAPEKLTVIYNYPPERTKRLGMAELPLVREGTLILIFVGRVSVAKGAVLLVDAVERMIRRGENLALWIVGKSGDSDNTYDELRERIALSDLRQQVSFLGHVDDVYSIYSLADIHVCPSLVTEALSHVVLEAKQSGKPSVVFPTGGLPELIEHKVDGYVCRESSVEALVDGIMYFAADAVKRIEAGAAARRSLEKKFGLVRFRRQWAEVFYG